MSDVSNGGEHGAEEAPQRSPIFVILAVIAVALAIGAVFLLFQRKSQYQALAKETDASTIPTVAVIHPLTEPGNENLVLPGTLQAYVESPIYARTNGYLRKWYHDIGSRVSKGEVLADIDAPEVDQQLSQGKADLVTAQANEKLSEITANRLQGLMSTNAIARQELDNALGDLAAKRAIVQSAEANVKRLSELKSFERVYAPFSGVITRRNVDIGTLINAGNGGSAQQLFSMAQTDPMRVFLNVPETYSASIYTGLGAYLELTQYPGQKFEGKVVRTAESIDLATRTLLTEVDIPNKNGQLLPGGYTQVHLLVKATSQRLRVPVNALLFRSEGLRAVVVDNNKHLRLQALQIGRDYGTSLEVLDGLKPDDWIVVNPADSLAEGQAVHVKETANPLQPLPAAAAPGNGASPQGSSAPAPAKK